jgi:hypothetical protein
VLEVGVGFPWELLVVVPTNQGLVLTRGAMFSYFEFPWDMNDRLTDAQWQEMQVSDDYQLPPIWVASYFAGPEKIASFEPSGKPEVFIDDTPIVMSIDNDDLDFVCSVTPNPFKEMVTFEVKTTRSFSVDIFNLSGELVAFLTTTNGIILWQSDLKSGIYWANLSYNGQKHYLKLIKIE